MSLKKHSKTLWIVLSIVGFAVVVFAVFLVYDPVKLFANNKDLRKAVFLTNGQVYFGYMANENKQYVTLKKIYYLRSVDTAAEGKISLVKLGSEVYGPDDSMKINRDHILYYEDMGENSKIAEAIKKNNTSK